MLSFPAHLLVNKPSQRRCGAVTMSTALSTNVSSQRTCVVATIQHCRLCPGAHLAVTVPRGPECGPAGGRAATAPQATLARRGCIGVSRNRVGEPYGLPRDAPPADTLCTAHPTAARPSCGQQHCRSRAWLARGGSHRSTATRRNSTTESDVTFRTDTLLQHMTPTADRATLWSHWAAQHCTS